jgi:hypothetical protein
MNYKILSLNMVSYIFINNKYSFHLTFLQFMSFITGKDFIVMLPFWHQIPQCDLYYLQLQGRYLPLVMRTARYILPIFTIGAVVYISIIALFA